MFAARDLAAGTEMPIKGPWFTTTKEVNEFLNTLPAATGESFSKRIFEVVTTSPEPGWESQMLKTAWRTLNQISQSIQQSNHQYRLTTSLPTKPTPTPASQSSNQPNNQLAKQPSNQPTIQPISQPSIQSASHPTSQPHTNKPTSL